MYNQIQGGDYMNSKDMMKILGGLGIFAALMWLIVWLVKKD